MHGLEADAAGGNSSLPSGQSGNPDTALPVRTFLAPQRPVAAKRGARSLVASLECRTIVTGENDQRVL
jgi:hypothetical protein